MIKIDTEKLISWFLKHKRKLPGRDITDPYPIWISEIMAQQTRMEAVKPYYERFLKEIPTIKSLALVQEEKLLKLWVIMLELEIYNLQQELLWKNIMVFFQEHMKIPFN